jgi:hypothetical protein
MAIILHRRTVLAGLSTLAFPAHAALNTANVADPDRRLEVYARVRGGAKGASALWGVSGIIYAKVNTEVALPLFRVIGASLNTITPRPDGGLTQVMEEAGYFADLTTGQIMAKWRNPLSNAETTPEPYKMKSTQGIAPDGSVERPNSPFPITVNGGVGTVETSGDVLWIAENFSARVGLLSPARDGRPPEIVPGKTRVIDSLATFQARIDDVGNPDLSAFVPATLAFTETDPWFPWMGMDERPGLQLWQLRGRKLRGSSELPSVLLSRLRSDYPGFI